MFSFRHTGSRGQGRGNPSATISACCHVCYLVNPEAWSPRPCPVHRLASALALGLTSSCDGCLRAVVRDDHPRYYCMPSDKEERIGILSSNLLGLRLATERLPVLFLPVPRPFRDSLHPSPFRFGLDHREEFSRRVWLPWPVSHVAAPPGGFALSVLLLVPGVALRWHVVENKKRLRLFSRWRLLSGFKRAIIRLIAVVRETISARCLPRARAIVLSLGEITVNHGVNLNPFG